MKEHSHKSQRLISYCILKSSSDVLKNGKFPKATEKQEQNKKYKNFKSLGFCEYHSPHVLTAPSASPLTGVHGNKQGSDENSPSLVFSKDRNLEIKASTTCEFQQNIVRWMENKKGIDLIVLESYSGEDAGKQESRLQSCIALQGGGGGGVEGWSFAIMLNAL